MTTPFQRVLDDLGCRCACHSGIGADSQCVHCAPPAKPSPGALYYQAQAEHPDDREAAGRRYVELMREHGHIVDREPGDDSPLFSCGYDPRKARRAT